MATAGKNHLYFRLAASEAGLAKGYLFAMGVPPPTNLEYKDHSERVPQGEGGESRHGFHVLLWTWERLTLLQLKVICDIVFNSSGLVYCSSPRSNGATEGYGWVDAYGRPSLSDPSPVGPIASATGIIVGNVSLTLNNLIIVNNPASF